MKFLADVRKWDDLSHYEGLDDSDHQDHYQSGH